MTLITRILHNALPATCWTCQSIVDQPGGLCASCWKGMHWIDDPLCPCCGDPLPYTQASCSDPQCSASPSDLTFFNRSACLYNGPSRALTLKLKYGRSLGCAQFMGERMAHVLSRWNIHGVLLPVPLHWSRLIQRRFNQALWLAQTISQKTGFRLISGLKRFRRTRSQGHETPQKRWENVRHAFRWQGKNRPSSVILIDDVYTTGSTLRACTLALRQANIDTIYSLTFAKVSVNFTLSRS